MAKPNRTRMYAKVNRHDAVVFLFAGAFDKSSSDDGEEATETKYS